MSVQRPDTSRIAPLAQPFSQELQAIFDRIMPSGVPPLVLFTTLARDPRLFEKFRNGSLLDKGHLTLRQREIVIHRVAARCGSEYEWGVHASFFAAHAELDPTQLAATIHGAADTSCWSADEQHLLEVCDQLHAGADISDALWTKLRGAFDEMAIVEVILLAGFYRTVAYLTNALRLPLEPFGQRFPAKTA